ncbi:hypothetical protein CLHUN_11750 [Ruminiclostridium hungatei]|uniref:Glycosyltransferase RgtA/B/C/D-like domain-containing protein n=1 Tax=Ruminiclostridium hungatei TaxID=48256 RepID=A0A1V4SMC4_RUMHU|nr:hypothetical protein [Ruminiclostridium hungatei]OPX44943.1 hypothetical protein CLHUN_11750 [Ruminiclostridium hungatei]
MSGIQSRFKTLAFGFLAMFFSFMWIPALLLQSRSAPFPEFSPQKPLKLLCLVIVAVLYFLILNKLSLVLSKISHRKLLFWTLALYALFQTAFIFIFPVNAYEDAVIVRKLALQFIEGNYTSLGTGKYLGYFPNNIGITVFFALLYNFFPNSYFTLRITNMIFNTISARLIYDIYLELYPEKRHKAYGVLLLAVSFAPPVLLINFTYGDILCNTFCLAAVLNAIRFVRHKAGHYGCYTALCLMAANFLRNVALLFLAAIVLYWLLNMRSKCGYSLKSPGCAALAIMLFNLPLKLLSLIGLKTGILTEPVGLHSNPVWRWVNMGFPGKKLGYWDGGRNTAIFVNRFKCDKHAAGRFFINEILEKYKADGFVSVLKAYARKTFWLWTEGTYSVNYYGLSQALRADRFMLYSTPFLRYIEPWDTTARLWLAWSLHSLNWLQLVFSSLYLFSAAIRKDFRMELLIYILYMYMGFYLLWEIKSRYLFGIYPVLLIMSYSFSEKIYNFIFKRKSRKA